MLLVRFFAILHRHLLKSAVCFMNSVYLNNKMLFLVIHSCYEGSDIAIKKYITHVCNLLNSPLIIKTFDSPQYTCTSNYHMSIYVYVNSFVFFLGQTILVGDSGVGKTSLLVQFDQGRFQAGSFSATVGIGFTVSQTTSHHHPIIILLSII